MDRRESKEKIKRDGSQRTTRQSAATIPRCCFSWSSDVPITQLIAQCHCCNMCCMDCRVLWSLEFRENNDPGSSRLVRVCPRSIIDRL